MEFKNINNMEEIIKNNTPLLKRILIGVLILGAFLLYMKCNNDKFQQLKGEYKVLKEQYNSQKNVVKNIEKKRLQEKNSLQKENSILEKQQKESKNKIAFLEKELVNKQIQREKDKERIKNLSYVETAKELNIVYNTNQAVATNNSVDLKGDLPNRVLDTAYDMENCAETSKIKDSVITEQRTIITNSEKEKKNLNKMLDSAEKEIEARKGLGELADKNIENLESQNKKLKNKNVGNKILILLGTVGGFILGNSLNK